MTDTEAAAEAIWGHGQPRSICAVQGHRWVEARPPYTRGCWVCKALEWEPIVGKEH